MLLVHVACVLCVRRPILVFLARAGRAFLEVAVGELSWCVLSVAGLQGGTGGSSSSATLRLIQVGMNGTCTLELNKK
jgi:hypothetical protein